MQSIRHEFIREVHAEYATYNGNNNTWPEIK